MFKWESDVRVGKGDKGRGGGWRGGAAGKETDFWFLVSRIEGRLESNKKPKMRNYETILSNCHVPYVPRPSVRTIFSLPNPTVGKYAVRHVSYVCKIRTAHTE